MGFRNRVEAGRALAKKLMAYAGRQDVLVLALPRDGVPVAYEVATALEAPLDVFIVHKLGVPGHEDLALGAVTSGGVRVFNHEVKNFLRVREPEIEVIGAREQKEVERRERLYRGDQPGSQVRGRTVILVDDGLASGAEMQAAVMALRLLQPARLIVAVPVLPVPVSEMWLQEADACVSVIEPAIRDSAGHWYADLPQTTDLEVQILLKQALGMNPAWLDETRAL